MRPDGVGCSWQAAGNACEVKYSAVANGLSGGVCGVPVATLVPAIDHAIGLVDAATAPFELGTRATVSAASIGLLLTSLAISFLEAVNEACGNVR